MLFIPKNIIFFPHNLHTSQIIANTQFTKKNFSTKYILTNFQLGKLTDCLCKEYNFDAEAFLFPQIFYRL